MTEALANYFRYNISRKETFVYLKDELKNICNYFKIQQHRFGDRISFEIVYHGIAEKDVQNCYIPKTDFTADRGEQHLSWSGDEDWRRRDQDPYIFGG